MKITVVTSYFPTSACPYGGTSAFNTLRFLKSHASIEVICPLGALPQHPGIQALAIRARRPDLATPGAQDHLLRVPRDSHPDAPVQWTRLRTHPAAVRAPLTARSHPELLALSRWIRRRARGPLLGVPVIVGAIGSDIRTRNDPVTIRLVRQTMFAADAVITVSEDLRQRAIAQGIPAEKVTAIRNGCDTSVFYPGDRALRSRKDGLRPGKRAHPVRRQSAGG